VACEPVRHPNLAGMKDLGRYLALEAISMYQRFVSPYKGFRCAYAYHTGCASCSRLGYRAIRWRGLATGLGLLFARFDRCRAVFNRFRERAAAPRTPSVTAPRVKQLRDQGGFCDALACIPCDAGCVSPCDALPVDGIAGAADALNCCTGCPTPCDFMTCGPEDTDKRRRDERGRRA
jgi:putative component of membrane protein insertase Oxa1/YidC/SpoIIIJ protein YidD